MRLEDVKGVGKVTLKKLTTLDIKSTEQLIGFMPKNYIDFNMPVLLNDAKEGHFSLFHLTITKIGSVIKSKKNLQFFTAEAKDFFDNAIRRKAKLVWFNQTYLYKQIVVDSDYLIFGKVKFNGNIIEIINPQIELFDKAKKLTGIMPVYRTRGEIFQGSLRSIIEEALKVYSPEKIISDNAVNKNKLQSLNEAYYKAHFPNSISEGIDAQKRIALEETVKEIIYYKIINSTAKNKRNLNYLKDFSIVDSFINSLEFTLSETQQSALQEINATLHSQYKMNLLLIGDVGSGKTIVALITMLYAVKCGYQAVLMSPTEILAQQHYNTAKKLFANENVNFVFHSGSVKGEERLRAEKAITDGTADIIIGTHSLFQKDITFKKLALVIIDEQHKFGVTQKFNLQQKGSDVDTLILTATPIPRTVKMLLYDELQLSQIEKKQQSDIHTLIVSDYKKRDMFSYIRDEAKKGNQAFIVCPKIFDSEGIETYSAISLYKELKDGIMKDINISIIHGKMKASDKADVMQKFVIGEIDVLISTTVIEVGIDIKNVTTIAVLNSEKFGLATLHQLRGRVGRGDKTSYCFLHTTDDANPRINALAKINDGLKLAELDFTLRGGGDYLGIRQKGDFDDDKYIVPITPDLIIEARKIALSDVLPYDIELNSKDYVIYQNKFKNITMI